MAAVDGSSRFGNVRWARGTLLHDLQPADRSALLTLGTQRSFGVGEALMIEDDRGTDAFVLLEGCVKVVGSAVDGRSILLSIRIGGDLVGELGALHNTPRSASVFTATAVVARAISQRTLARFMAEHPVAARAIHGAVADKFRRATRHRIDINGASVRNRLALVLHYLAETYGRPHSDGIRIEVPLSQPELASLIGVSEPSLQRAVRELRDQDVIKSEYRRQIVRDPEALRKLATQGGGPPDNEKG
ncbi:Crp/Fnr family transcriptional regulator [Micromonospora sp. NBC_01796]|uniref:Crp/Fnr family transcriptional regulator n=1 Tax=Micromonospora sp. NBC_01796 TaxID=2975987 RepID=UPI002DDB31A3|nr:Crp/Fnr family transcriptional regulator [Micromonospora sp. NBC_01796]WSA87295.1 Crp/Fnr family transcriptional regulator [Micromonospora sp. NBC_01796]